MSTFTDTSVRNLILDHKVEVNALAGTARLAKSVPLFLGRQDSVSAGVQAADNWVQDTVEAGAARLRESGHRWLAKGVSATEILGAAAAATVSEVAGQTLVAGSNAVLTLHHGDESIGTDTTCICNDGD
jgi:hypothetical protein